MSAIGRHTSGNTRLMDHDHSYKLLCSHRDMMADLLRGFVTAEWVHTLDLTTPEQVQSSQVSDDLRDREDDIIWHVRWQGDWLYIALIGGVSIDGLPLHGCSAHDLCGPAL